MVHGYRPHTKALIYKCLSCDLYIGTHIFLRDGNKSPFEQIRFCIENDPHICPSCNNMWEFDFEVRDDGMMKIPYILDPDRLKFELENLNKVKTEIVV